MAQHMRGLGAPRPPPFSPPNRLCFLQGFPFPQCPFPTPNSCLFSCPFLLFLCLKEECSLIPCTLPIPSCLALPHVSPKLPGVALAPQLPCSITPAMFLLLLEGTTAKRCSSKGDRATSQLRRAGAGGAWSPHHTDTPQPSQFIPPPVAVSMEKCQDSQQGSKPCCWWEPSQPSREAGAGAQCEPRACTPSLTAGSGEHTVGSGPGWFHPTFRPKVPEKTWSEGKGVSCSRSQSPAGGASPTWLVLRSPGSRRAVPTVARWKDASGGDATIT